MGVDLKLLPVDFIFEPGDSRRNESEQFSCASILELTRSSGFWEIVRKLPSQEITAPLRTPLGVFEEDNSLWDLRERIWDEYEEILRWVTAKDLVSIRYYLPESNQNRAAWVYLAELPPQTKVVLYWC